MQIKTRKISALAAGMAATALTLAAHGVLADEDDEVPFNVARLFFQLNDTDEDLGIHLLLDGEPWKTLEIDGPDDRRLFYVNTQSKLRRQGLTEFKFESAEPSFDEFPAAAFFRRFREGEYDIEGRGLDGIEYESTVVISHLLPAPIENLRVDGAATPDDCDEDPGPNVSATPLLTWDPVTTSHPELGRPGDVEILRYEVAVERDEPSLKLEANVHVEDEPIVAFQVPAGLLDSGDEIKFQVLVQDVGGNETSSESCFVVN